MKEIIYAIGACMCACWVLGAIGVMDCHLCAKAAGQCKAAATQKGGGVMATDRELIEAAAKAAGIPSSPGGDLWSEARGLPWNPLTSDADAFRLAVALQLDVLHNEPRDHDAWVMVGGLDHVETVDGEENRPAATRRAITRAAAHIGGLTDA